MTSKPRLNFQIVKYIPHEVSLKSTIHPRKFNQKLEGLGGGLILIRVCNCKFSFKMTICFSRYTTITSIFFFWVLFWEHNKFSEMLWARDFFSTSSLRCLSQLTFFIFRKPALQVANKTNYSERSVFENSKQNWRPTIS